MVYNYKLASDLVKWCREQYQKPNAYRLTGIGRYENGVRIFDCVGMIKCFIWRDYSQTNSTYYRKTCPDFNCEQFFNLAKEKGAIKDIPEIPGLMVYQEGHIGVYLGGGQVIECTAAFDKKICITYFKGDHPDTKLKRATWTHWFKHPYLTYEATQKTTLQIAREVLAGKWKNGTARKKLLLEAGYNYKEVQDKVNELLKQSENGKLEEVAREVIQGKWGNGAIRKKKLEEAGYDYEDVQEVVNALLKD